jgi:hypothetical protein
MLPPITSHEVAAMNRERIAQAIEILRAVPKKKFDLGRWADVHGDKRVPESRCLTTACAMGWIASQPQNIAKGLYLQREYDNCAIVWPVYRGAKDFEAAMSWFGITDSTAELLFSPAEYPDDEQTNPRFVIERLELLLASRESTFREMML